MSKKSNLVTIIICLAIVVIGIGATVFFLKGDKDEIRQGGIIIDTAATSDSAGLAKNPLADRQIYFAGINDCIIDHDSMIYLENPAENEDIYIAYKIFDAETDVLVYETDLIPSGEHLTWTPSENLKPGDYSLNFTQVPYWRASENDEWQTLTNGNNTVNVTITD